MKFNLKMIAVAAAMVSTAGAAQADVFSSFNENGTLVLQAFNTVTRSYYIRDLGFTLNDFLPSGALASAGDPGGVAVGNKTPNAGLNLNAGNTANFGDTEGWTTWLSGQNTSNIRWNVSAVDSVGTYRAIASSVNGSETALNGDLSNFVSDSYAGSVEGYAGIATGGTSGLSYTRATDADANLDSNWGLGSDGLGVLGGTASLYYFLSTGPSGAAAGGKFANSENAAVVSLAANGDFSYTLAAASAPSAVPLPAAAWLMGAGLFSLFGAARRRKSADMA